MARQNPSIAVTFSPADGSLRFWKQSKNGSLKSTSMTLRRRVFDDQYFSMLSKTLEDYVGANPVKDDAVALVLPDSSVALDILSLPAIGGFKQKQTVEVALEKHYINRKELKINVQPIATTKQINTFALAAIRGNIVDSFNSAFNAVNLPIRKLTFSSASVVDGVGQILPRLRNASYILIDMDADSATIIFVNKGRVSGFYPLPFGHGILTKHRLAAEDILFDHSVADLAVINAKERAKAKALTMMGDGASQMGEFMSEDEETDDFGEAQEQETNNEEEEEQDYFNQDNNSSMPGDNSPLIKVLPKKQPRKLPKFMLRPMPESEEDYVYENFRLFVKWTLNLIQSNEKLIQNAEPDAVYVNLSDDLSFVFDRVNEEQQENGIAFLPLGLTGQQQEVVDNLNAFGGFCATTANKNNIF